ncbi:MAG: NUDIX hydrolase [Candidatus Pacebacteria bacterium]|nr:NUDIX hydrolase [Candidatus Paceibacterota bacterium]
MIECRTLFGKKKLISKEKLQFRPAAYAVIINFGKVLLLDTRSTGKLFLPGGGVELGESIEKALRREVKEEIGIKIEIVKFKESFFYYDPLGEAYQNLSFFFLCKPKTFDLLNNNKIEDGEAFNPQWINIKDLKEEIFQAFGKEIIKFFKDIN